MPWGQEIDVNRYRAGINSVRGYYSFLVTLPLDELKRGEAGFLAAGTDFRRGQADYIRLIISRKESELIAAGSLLANC